jgi:hypothetical protein
MPHQIEAPTPFQVLALKVLVVDFEIRFPLPTLQLCARTMHEIWKAIIVAMHETTQPKQQLGQNSRLRPDRYKGGFGFPIHSTCRDKKHENMQQLGTLYYIGRQTIL